MTGGRDIGLEEAAELCDRTANLYDAYAREPRRTPEERTCAELAARIRNLKGC